MQRTTHESEQSCAQGFASSSYPTVCLSVLDARTRWQEPGVTFTTDRLGRRCLEPTLLRVKDSFVKYRGGTYARGGNGSPIVPRYPRSGPAPHPKEKGASRPPSLIL